MQQVSSLVHSGTVEREDVERVMRMLDRKDFARAAGARGLLSSREFGV